MIRDSIASAQIAAMKAGDKPRLAAIRLVMSAIKNRDIEERGKKAAAEGRTTSFDDDGAAISPLPYVTPTNDDVMVSEVLQKMIKQRRESIAMYETGGRQELADIEAGEIAVIETFLPQRMSEADAGAAIDAVIAELGAASLKDMGRVMTLVKERHAGAMDLGKASALVKARLGS